MKRRSLKVDHLLKRYFQKPHQRKRFLKREFPRKRKHPEKLGRKELFHQLVQRDVLCELAEEDSSLS